MTYLFMSHNQNAIHTMLVKTILKSFRIEINGTNSSELAIRDMSFAKCFQMMILG